jgi:UPF0176 protein
VLLAPEGINLFLAGRTAALRALAARAAGGLAFRRPGAEGQSAAEAVPFRRLRVKLKREIIRMNQPKPSARGRPRAGGGRAHAGALAAQGHDDQGRPVVMLDTRNGFEVDQGAFDGAIDWRLHKFSDFPAALAPPARTAGATIVSYCTGGIRCEKAALLMREQGLSHTLQLDGGILKYFEDTDSPARRTGTALLRVRRTRGAGPGPPA